MQMNGGSQASYSAVKEITTDEKVTSGTYSSDNSDENAISVSGKITSSLDGVTVTKTGDSDGGDVTLYLKNQKVTGNIVVDTISTLSMSLTSNSSYTGIINGDKKAHEINLTLDKSSKIKLTGDSYVTSLDNEDSSNSNIDFNGYKLYVDGVAIN